MSEIVIDRYDLQLLAALQRQGQATNAELGEKANLSASQISRRIQRLEEAKVISGYAALLDPPALAMATLTPISCPLLLNSGPPELPGLIAASVWMNGT